MYIVMSFAFDRMFFCFFFLMGVSVFLFLPIGKEVKCNLQGVRFDLGQIFFSTTC